MIAKLLILVAAMAVSLRTFSREVNGKVIDLGDLIPDNSRRNGPYTDRDRFSIFEYADVQTGEIVAREFRKNGRIRKFGMYRMGRQDGIQREWFDNGLRQSVSTFSGGVKNGVFKQWDESGKLISRYLIVNGNGDKIVYNSKGLLMLELKFKNDKETGMSFERYADGRLEFMEFDNGHSVGDSFVFGKDGNLLNFCSFNIKGELNGIAADFDKDGHLLDLKRFVNGVEVNENEFKKAAKNDSSIHSANDGVDPNKLVTKNVKNLYEKYSSLPPVKIPLDDPDDKKGE